MINELNGSSGCKELLCKECKELVVILNDEDFRYTLFEIVSIFFNGSRITFSESKPENETGDTESTGIIFFTVNLSLHGEGYDCHIKLENDKGLIDESLFNTSEDKDFESDDLLARSRKVLKTKVYIMLSGITGKTFPWGSLTGIRPAKIVNKMLDKGCDKEEILNRLKNVYFVTPKKADLAYEVALTQYEIRKSRNPVSVSVYIGIPFCPTRCLYCSFTSNPISRYENMADKYIDTLINEMGQVSREVFERGLGIESIYIGGGTPTSLSAPRLDRLLNSINDIWVNNNSIELKEFCVEAGRPDSIDREKLSVMKDAGVSRISINPQTMHDKTLRLIGRCHTSLDVERAFNLAREAGFSNINTDIIAGLPDETADMFNYTLERIFEFKPESLTVHTMSIKRASELRNKADQYNLSGEVTEMIDSAYNYAKQYNMKPYYMYRQKNMLGNLENIGYSVPGKESYYNIHIMEEDQTVLAFGSGAVTKYVTPVGDDFQITRVFNVKGVEDYILRSQEMVERKISNMHLILM